MKAFIFCILILGFTSASYADYERNKAVPVEKVLFGKVKTVRNLTETELIQDRDNGWKSFGGALIGGTIGNQFGSGRGRVVTTILGALIGSTVASQDSASQQQITWHLVELMIVTERGEEYMVIQDFDQQMIFQPRDKIRMIYLADGSVRIDKQF